MAIRRPRYYVDHSDWTLLNPAGLVVLALAVCGALWLVSALRGETPVEMSRWPGNANAATIAQGLSGQATLSGAAVAVGSKAFLPLPPDGPFRQNVVAALEANGGALKQVVIPPGGRWSFNRAVGDPGLLTLATINGIYGGGWCDLASRYVVALRPILPPEAINFPRHRDVAGIGLAGVADDDAVAIWNTNNRGGEQDLIITNMLDRPIVMAAQLGAAGVEVRASVQP